MSGGPVFLSVNQGMPLDCLSLVANGAFIHGFHGTVTNGETVLSWLPPPGNSADSRLKHTPSLYGKEAYLLVLELQPKGQASDFTYIYRSTEVFSGEGGQADTICVLPSATLQVASISWKGACTLISCPNFCNRFPEDGSRSPGSDGQ